MSYSRTHHSVSERKPGANPLCPGSEPIACSLLTILQLRGKELFLSYFVFTASLQGWQRRGSLYVS